MYSIIICIDIHYTCTFVKSLVNVRNVYIHVLVHVDVHVLYELCIYEDKQNIRKNKQISVGPIGYLRACICKSISTWCALFIVEPSQKLESLLWFMSLINCRDPIFQRPEIPTRWTFMNLNGSNQFINCQKSEDYPFLFCYLAFCRGLLEKVRGGLTSNFQMLSAVTGTRNQLCFCVLIFKKPSYSQ